MAKVKIQGHASGTGVLTVTAPNTSTDRTITLPDSTGTLSVDKSITDNGNATAMTIGADENIGIGVVPKAWHSSGVALQVGAGGCVKGHTTDERVALLSNAYEAASDGNWKRVLTGLAANVNIDNGVVNFETAVTGSADSNITWTNPVQIDSEGIKFNGDTAAANALNDYEEGTWTVGWTSTNNTFNPSTTTGYYTKVGNLVTISYHAYLSGAPTLNDSANGFSFTGLPFTSSSGKSSTITWGHKRWMEWPSNTTDVMLDIEAVSTTIQTLARTSIGELYNIRAVTFSRNGSGISFAGHYYTDS